MLIALALAEQPLEQTAPDVPPPTIIVPALPSPEVGANAVNPTAGKLPTESKYLSVIVSRIFFPPRVKATIAPDKRDNLSSCDASQGAAMIAALQDCWPVLQSYQALGDVMGNMTNHLMAEAFADESAHDSELQMQTRTLKGADEVIALASERKWPLQDLILIMAHSMKREIYEDLQEYDLALEQLEHTETIAKSSRMTEPGFELLKDGTAIRKSLLRKKEMALQAERR